MKASGTLLVAVATAASLLGTTGCGAETEPASEPAHLAARVCDTGISTAPIKKLFPSPYDEAYQSFSPHDSLSSLRKGRKAGDCSVSLVYDDRHGAQKLMDVNVHAVVSDDDTAEDLMAHPELMDLSVGYSVRAGEMSGITGRDGAAVAFPCAKRPDRAKSVKVEIHFTPHQLNVTEKRKRQLATTAGTYVVQAARYLNEHYLTCLSPAALSGSVRMQRAKAGGEGG
jgi:hypothetical protein